MLEIEKFQEARFEKFWEKVWQDNQIPYTSIVKAFALEVYKRGCSDAMNETSEYAKYLISGRRQ